MYQKRREPLFVFVFEEALLRFTYRKPQRKPLLQLPPNFKAMPKLFTDRRNSDNQFDYFSTFNSFSKTHLGVKI